MSNNNLLNLNLKSNGLKLTSKVEENEKNYKEINPAEILVNNPMPKEYRIFDYDLIIDVNAPEEKANDIFKKYVKEWEYINPNLKITDAKIYMNTFINQILVINFIPIEKTLDKNNEYKEEQTRILKALKQQGCIDKEGHPNKILWCSNQKNILEDICKECDFEISHQKCNHKSIEEILK